MKIRNGFVSNSSSSSFIVGYGIIESMNAFETYCKRNHIDFHIMKDQGDYPDDVCVFGHHLLNNNLRIIEAGNNTELIIPKEFDKVYNREFLRVEIKNDEGDSIFYDEAMGDMNYHIAKKIDFYSTQQQAIIKLFEQPFIKKGEVLIGAERNG